MEEGKKGPKERPFCTKILNGDQKKKKCATANDISSSYVHGRDEDGFAQTL